VFHSFFPYVLIFGDEITIDTTKGINIGLIDQLTGAAWEKVKERLAINGFVSSFFPSTTLFSNSSFFPSTTLFSNSSFFPSSTLYCCVGKGQRVYCN